MSRATVYDAAIVGAGLAGSILAASLARSAPPEYRALLLDRLDAGAGTAYRPQSSRLLMNGPLRAMSLVPGDKTHLVRSFPDRSVEALIPRAEFGEYARATLRAALARHDGITFERREIVDVARRDNVYELRDDCGVTVFARNVVFALGNFAPAGDFVPAVVRLHAGYVPNPWTFDAARAGNDDVLLIGSGLTAMDVVALLEERNFPGIVHLVSRHGLLPQIEHPEVRELPVDSLDLDLSSPRSLVRSLRRAARVHAEDGGDWRAVAESIRTISPSIWMGWSLAERRQFLRHVQPYWTAHRYRVPAPTYDAFERLRGRGRVVLHRGRIRDASLLPGGKLAIHAASPRGNSEIVVDSVVNCTGPQGNYAALAQPLVRNAMRRGLLRPDALQLGIDANQDLNLLDARGIPQTDLFTLGPPLRGVFYETTAVPETRDQAARIASVLIEKSSILLEAAS
jgi:uncharacterized NAD(P)/FAD-binding protein YdhS